MNQASGRVTGNTDRTWGVGPLDGQPGLKCPDSRPSVRDTHTIKPTVLVIRPITRIGEQEREWHMSEMIPFRYGGFWDVPRFILLRYRGKALLLESPFDESLDEYPDDYAVYELPDGTEWSELPEGSWIRDETPRSLIGRIPIDKVAFDPTKRRALDPGCLDTLFAAIQR